MGVATQDEEIQEEEAAPTETRPTAAAPPPLPRTPVEPVVVPRWVQMVLLPLIILGGYALILAASNILLLVIIASLFALLLNPFVTLLRRTGLPRGVSVMLVFLALLMVVVGIGVALANPIADQVSSISDNVPEYVDDANNALGDVQQFFDDNGINVEIQKQGKTALQTLGDRLTEGSGSFVKFTRDALTKLVEASLAFILLLVLTIYLLIYGERIGTLVRKVMPTGDGTPEDDFPTRIQQAVLGYVRGQLLFSLLMGTGAGVMLLILGLLGIFPEGKTYALAFGVFFGFAELIPYIGPAIGAMPPILIATFGSHPIDAVWLIIAFTALQQLEGHVVAPNLFGSALRINPILVIIALLLGGQLYGIIGALIALPIAAMIRETVEYCSRHLTLEPWPRMQLAGASAGLTDTEPADTAPCPECGVPLAPGAAFCSSCGTEIDGDDAATRAAGPG
jgi:predicted PurR-regulated permease PerM